MTTKLTLDDIRDLRAYERERDAFRTQVIQLKKRRIGVGPIVTLLFEGPADAGGHHGIRPLRPL